MDKNFRILFVDDEQPVLNGIRRIFQARRSDWELVFATSGKEALQKATVIDFDLIVTDGKMPGMSGSEMLLEMKKRGITKDVPTIMLTGYVDDNMRKEALECGIIEFVNKPVIPDEFVLRIENVLNLKMMHDELKTSSKELESSNEELNKLYGVIKEQKEELQELNDVKSQFIEIAMKDFRNSTQAISDLSDEMINKIDPEKEPELIELARKISDRSAEMMNIYTKIMNVADITSGNLELKYSRVNILNFYSELVDQLKILAASKDIEVQTFHDNILPVESFLDLNKLTISLTRIMENAVKYSEESTHVEFGLMYKDGNLIFMVRDHGMGMTDDDMQNIFKFAAENEEGVKKQGVSLPIVKKIIESHKGRIDVDTKFGGGSTFSVSIPLLEDIE